MLYFLIAIGVLATLIVALLLTNVTVDLHLDDSDWIIRGKVHLLFLHFRVLPEEESDLKFLKKDKSKKKNGRIKGIDDDCRDKRVRQDDKEEAEGSALKRIYKRRGIEGVIKAIKLTIRDVWRVLLAILDRIDLKNLSVKINVAGEDAAQSAITCGWIYSVLYPIVGAVLNNVKKFDEYSLEAIPDYTSQGKTSFVADIRLKIKIFRILGLVLKHYDEINFLMLILDKK